MASSSSTISVFDDHRFLVSDEEAAVQEELPYKSFVRGKEVDFSPSNIRRVMRFKRETAGAQIDYKTR
ncbi:hypothetical protein PIB30_093044 [Stylosanthes scabra]|uniref:Uncharacterized protein n=1 Tax=Stylosanthes scabra TaxID=79078 RepID=A0ABU6YT89_9FABA|nr:hypothetical protein [Stylosanthes scabra]